MTWLRWDTTAASSDVVGALAKALNVELAHAFGLYVACCLGFGEHRPDGLAGEVEDDSLEHWAMWRGKRGRFAAAFRTRCVDEAGVIRGWWRQERLIARQSANNAHRKKTGTEPEENRQEPAPKMYDDVDDTVRNGTNQTTTTWANSRLINALGRDTARFTVMALFEHLPPEESPDAWSGVLLSCLQGGMAQGKSATVAQLAAACADFPAVVKGKWSPRYFRACVESAMRGEKNPRAVKASTAKMLAEAEAWKPPEAA